jgi:hypothetical protein
MFGCRVRKCSTQSEHRARATQQIKQTPATDKKRRPLAFRAPHKEIQFQKQVLKSLGCVEGLRAGAVRGNNRVKGAVFTSAVPPVQVTQCNTSAQTLLGTGAINTCYIDCATGCTIWGNGFRVPAEAKAVSLLHIVQIGYGTHPGF